MDNYLECPICYDFANEAVETNCCNKIFCESCVVGLKETNGSKTACPMCRKSPIKATPSILARRMIGSMPCECPNECDVKHLTRSGLPDHLNKYCPNRLVKCSFPKCNFNGKITAYLAHITQQHGESLIVAFDFCNNNNDLIKKHITKNDSNDDNKDNSNDNINDNDKHIDPIVGRTNSRGYYARLGETGKFYCGHSAKLKCACCNGYCGPTNGCNCYSCMELDVKYRKLPKGYLVNMHGFNSRISNETGKFYCGRKICKSTAQHDGYCGPTNGPSCRACQYLDRCANQKYPKLL